jgi:hypothetical protein
LALELCDAEIRIRKLEIRNNFEFPKFPIPTGVTPVRDMRIWVLGLVSDFRIERGSRIASLRCGLRTLKMEAEA